MSGSSSRTKTITMIEGALCIALAAVLSKLILFALPQGGSMDLELVPLLLFAWRRGLRWGCGAGALMGVVKILMGDYVLNPVQALLDYPLAYACVGLAALFPRLKTEGHIMGTILAAVGQIACHVVSGVIFFGEYAPEGQNPWMYSLVYNTPVISVKYIISAIAAYFLWRALERVLPQA